MADIFLDCAPATSDDRRRYQIWTASPEKRGSTSFGASFAFARAGYLPQGAGPLSFADMNRDGTIDVVFTSCDAEDCYVNIAYNRQIDLCDKTNTAAGGTIDVSRSWRDWKEWLIGSGGGGEGSGGRKNESSGDTAPDPPAAAVSCRRTDELCSPDDNFQLKLDAKDDTHVSRARDGKVALSVAGTGKHGSALGNMEASLGKVKLTSVSCPRLPCRPPVVCDPSSLLHAASWA